MKLIKGFVIIFSCLFLGETLSFLLPVPLPGNIWGMALLFIALVTGLVKLESVEEAGDLLLEHLILFFVPISIGIIQYTDLIRAELLSFIVIGVGGFLLLFITSGKLIDLLVKIKN